MAACLIASKQRDRNLLPYVVTAYLTVPCSVTVPFPQIEVADKNNKKITHQKDRT